MKVKTLDWDSHFFKKKIGVIWLDLETEIVSDNEKFDLLYVHQNADKIIDIDNFIHTYTETKVVFSKRISSENLLPNRFIFSPVGTVINIEEIYKLAFESGKCSRFKLDANFEEDEFKVLYKTWVDNSFSKELADSILIYQEQNSILAFITYKTQEDVADIGLFAVSATHQGKGIGKKLMEAVENELSKRKIKELRIPTQLHNKQACGFYTKLGYQITEKIITKHYWRLKNIL